MNGLVVTNPSMRRLTCHIRSAVSKFLTMAAGDQPRTRPYHSEPSHFHYPGLVERERERLALGPQVP